MNLGSAAGFQIDFEARHSDGVRRNQQLLSTTGVCCSSVLQKLLPLPLIGPGKASARTL
jgi:hypothetical protein